MIGEQIGVFIYELITGEDHPQHQTEAINNQVISEQNQMIADAVEAMWDAYVHSIELQVQEQHNQALAIVGIIEDIAADPKGAVDWVTGVGGVGLGVLGTSATLGIISIPVAGQVVIGVAGIACSVWGVGRLARLW